MPIGVIVNTLSIAVGGVAGAIWGSKLSQEFKEKLNQIFGVCAMGIGITSIVLLQNLPAVILSLILGTIVGMLPGLGPINGVAILLPFAYALGLPPESALILLAAVYLGCEYGGRISAILINVPGDAAAMFVLSAE